VGQADGLGKYGRNMCGKCSLGKPRRRKDNIKMLLTDMLVVKM
jgi:hypothetical protein